MTLDPTKTLEYSQYLLELDEDERKTAGQTLNQALLAATPDEEVGRPPVSKLGEYLDTPIDKPPILVEPGVVAVGSISALVSRGGKGKTAVSLNRLLRWSMGKPLFDEVPDLMRPIKPLRILIIENEGNGGHFQMILGRILSESGFAQPDIDLARENVYIWGDGGWSGLKLDREADFQLVDRAAALTEADIVFVEPFRGLWQGEENSATDMAIVCDKMSEIANKHGCAVMLTHHERKSGAGEGPDADPMSAARGSGVLEGAAAVMERWLPVKANRQRELSCMKNRFDNEYTPVRMEYDRERWGYRYVAEDERLRAAKGILASDPGAPMTLKEVSDELDETEQRMRKTLNELADDKDQPVAKQRVAGAYVYRYTGTTDDAGDGGISI